MAGSRRRAHRPADQRRSVAHLRVGRHAPAQAVHPRRHRAGWLSRARAVSAVDAMDRQGRQGHSLPDAVLELVSRPRRVSGAGHRRAIAMCPHRVVAAVATIVLASGPASAQDWTEFVSKEDRFTTNFPGAPVVKESTYKSQFG